MISSPLNQQTWVIGLSNVLCVLYIFVYICMYVYIYLCICIRVCVFICICMYVALGAPKKKNGLREYEIIIEPSFV